MWTKADVPVFQFVIEGLCAVNVGFCLHMVHDEETYAMIDLALNSTFVFVRLYDA